MSYGGGGSQGSAWLSSVVLWFQERRGRKAGADGTTSARQKREARIQARKTKPTTATAEGTDETPVSDG
jgi:hypothetical protein